MSHDWLDCLRPTIGDAPARRQMRRLPGEGAFCTELVGAWHGCATVTDFSSEGLRLHRPYRGDCAPIVQLEFDLPGVDEVIWAKGITRFDRIWRTPSRDFVHSSGVHIVAAATRHLRLLREFVAEQAQRFMPYGERRSSPRPF